jgi:hypothetical protein
MRSIFPRTHAWTCARIATQPQQQAVVLPEVTNLLNSQNERCINDYHLSRAATIRSSS